jgi:hypothetical protein
MIVATRPHRFEDRLRPATNHVRRGEPPAVLFTAGPLTLKARGVRARVCMPLVVKTSLGERWGHPVLWQMRASAVADMADMPHRQSYSV